MYRSLLVIPLAAATATAQAADNGFYVGASIGQAGMEDLVDDLDFDADDTGYKVFAGFRFFDWLGAEASYIDLGSPSDEILGEDVNGDADAFDAFLVGFLPITTFDVFAKVGAVAWDSRFDIEDVDFVDDDDGVDLAYGVGAQFRLGSAALRAEYERFEFGRDADMVSVGVSWTFL
jgi:hypothetical protein